MRCHKLLWYSASCPGSAGTHAVRDSLASDFPLRETGKSDKGIVQFLNWTMKATYVAFRHDSNPFQVPKRAGPNGVGSFCITSTRKLSIARYSFSRW